MPRDLVTSLLIREVTCQPLIHSCDLSVPLQDPYLCHCEARYHIGSSKHATRLIHAEPTQSTTTPLFPTGPRECILPGKWWVLFWWRWKWPALIHILFVFTSTKLISMALFYHKLYVCMCACILLTILALHNQLPAWLKPLCWHSVFLSVSQCLIKH